MPYVILIAFKKIVFVILLLFFYAICDTSTGRLRMKYSNRLNWFINFFSKRDIARGILFMMLLVILSLSVLHTLDLC